MSRPRTKLQLQQASQVKFEKLFALIDCIPSQVQTEPFVYNDRDDSLKDVLIHLYEWQILLLTFIDNNINKTKDFVQFLPQPYNFRTYPKMNEAFKEKHQNTKLECAKSMLQKSHTESMCKIATLPEETLFIKKYYKWCGNTSLGSYCVSSTSSHYDWAIKCIKKRLKNL